MELEEILPKKAVGILKKKKIRTVNDLCRLVPRKYKDYRKVVAIHEAEEGKECAIKGHFLSFDERGTYPKCLVANLLDETTGNIMQVSWFGQYYMKNFLKLMEGNDVVACGKLTIHPTYGYQMSAPDVFCLEEEYQPKILTVYKKFSGISEQTLKKGIYQAVKNAPEPLKQSPYKIGYKEALFRVHYPKSVEDIKAGKERIFFQDLLYFSMELKKNEADQKKGFCFPEWNEAVAFVDHLSFPLTKDQKDALNKILSHTKKGERCNVLLQGDVGCGKTIVAITAMVNAVENGYQAVLCAPTQVLAEQHYKELTERLGCEVAYLHSGMKAAEKRQTLKKIKSGEIKFIVGTHSVFAKDVQYDRLGMIVTDEEHKFGVAQKKALKEKAEEGCHLLSMSATPIPRSLASVYFGEGKEILVIKTMPKGRQPVQTAIQRGHKNTFSFMEKELEKGHQCYVVCPAIESAEDNDIKSVKEVEKEYRAYFEPIGRQVGILHGKMSKQAITDTIEQFSKGELSILISTTVVEVGVNVPNATVMVIEQADRFGLASLHQLRGRVGRGTEKSYCILISDDLANERLQVMCSTTDGFKIAEEDLKLRGAGDLIGTRQSGYDKYLTELLDHPDIYEKAKEMAEVYLENGYGKALEELYDSED